MWSACGRAWGSGSLIQRSHMGLVIVPLASLWVWGWLHPFCYLL